MPTIPGWGQRLQREHWGDTLGLVLLALLIAGPGLGSPDVLVFDEAYYVSDAVSHLEFGVGRGFQAHPPLGTWLIAAGMAAIGETPVGWRLVPLAFGCITVLALHRISRRLFSGRAHCRAWAVAAPLLLMVDGSWFTMSRIAMLDGLLATLVLLAVLAAVAHAQGQPTGWGRWALLGAGAASGAAAAVKLSGVVSLALVPTAVYIVGHGTNRARLSSAGRSLVGTAVFATVVYGAAWIPFAATRDDVAVASCWEVARPCPEEGGVAGVVAQHAMFFRFHTNYVSPNRQTSSPSVWPLSIRPVTLYTPGCHPSVPLVDVLDRNFDCPDPGPTPDTITFRANPVIWFGFLALLPLLAATGVRGDRSARVALVGWSAQWLPWLVVTRGSFLFYMTPAVPFMTLGIVAAVASTRQVRPLLPTATGGLGGAAAVATTAALGTSPAAIPITMAGVGILMGLRATQVAKDTDTTGSMDLVALALIVVAAAVSFAWMLPDLTVAAGG